MANEPEKVYSSTRFGCEPGEEDITINYFGNRRFEVRGKDIAGPLIFATDDSLDPDVPKGAKLLVNERQTTVDSGGYYVFRNANGVKRQPDGPTNRHKNDPLVRVGYLLQETA